jgi:formylglycine-generating enzyme
MARDISRIFGIVVVLLSCGKEASRDPDDSSGGDAGDAAGTSGSGGSSGGSVSSGGSGPGGTSSGGAATGGSVTGGSAGKAAGGATNGGSGGGSTAGAAATGGSAGGPAGSGGTAGTRSDCSDEGEAGADSGEGGDGSSARPASCEALADTCGPCENENCCTSLHVPGGSFLRSYDGDQYIEEIWPATVSDFRLDRFEVTVGRFRKFVEAYLAGWRPEAGSGKHTHVGGGLGIEDEIGWLTEWEDWIPETIAVWENEYNLRCSAELQVWTPEPGEYENHAMNCVDWFEAYAFCIWDGGFLPTEAEWNYAAAGGDEQREYPWGGDEPTRELALYSCRDGAGCFWPVGSFPAGDGRFGQADLAGNRWEWTLDSTDESEIDWGECAAGLECTSYSSAECNDCADIGEEYSHSKRGGSNTDAVKNIRAALRSSWESYEAGDDVGFRCARAP